MPVKSTSGTEVVALTMCERTAIQEDCSKQREVHSSAGKSQRSSSVHGVGLQRLRPF